MTSPNPTGTTPHCYRHQDRETYISCQRCGRPICPDCMRAASVGFQCPQCIAEGAKTVRSPRTVAGGLVPQRVGRVTQVLIGLNVVIFLAIQVQGSAAGGLADQLAMLTSNAFQNGPGGVHLLTGVDGGAYWRLLTAAFVHEQFLHIALNMYFLLIVGPIVERLLGTARFIALYLTCAVASSVMVLYFSAPNGLTVGASGALFGLMGALLVIVHRHGGNASQILMLLGLNLVFTFVFPGISWQGHIGGLVAGLLLGGCLAYAPRARRAQVHVVSFAVVWVAVVALTLVHTSFAVPAT
ncbi:MAG: rhomboid family intramembrane serine protease [Nocardioidaceae bacterium]